MPFRTTKTPCNSSFCRSLSLADSAEGSCFSAASAFPLAFFSLSSSSRRVRMVKAWIGIVTAFWRVAVVILAVVESPGRSPGGGLSRVTTTLKSLASSVVLVVLAVVVCPVVRLTAAWPISVTRPLKVLLGMASMVTSAGWLSLTLTMSVSSTFTSAVITERSETWNSTLPVWFWMPGTTFSPMCTGKEVMTPSRGEV